MKNSMNLQRLYGMIVALLLLLCLPLGVAAEALDTVTDQTAVSEPADTLTADTTADTVADTDAATEAGDADLTVESADETSETSDETDETAKTGFRFNPASLKETLPVMGMGMLGIFIVTVTIVLVVIILRRFGGKSEEDE